MVSLWTVGKANHKPGFLSETDYKILKSYLPIIKMNKGYPSFVGIGMCVHAHYTDTPVLVKMG